MRAAYIYSSLIKPKTKLKHQACSNWHTKYYWPWRK